MYKEWTILDYKGSPVCVCYVINAMHMYTHYNTNEF